MVKVNIEDGYYLFKLNDILRNRNISKNKLMRETNTDFKVIQRIINGELTKLDIIVLARICNEINVAFCYIFYFKVFFLKMFIFLSFCRFSFVNGIFTSTFS